MLWKELPGGHLISIHTPSHFVALCLDKQVFVSHDFLHALCALDSCSFHLSRSVLWLLNLEAFTYELGAVQVPGEAFDVVAGERQGGLARAAGVCSIRERDIYPAAQVS